MRVAIVSDIHGNRHAFEAVLDAIEASECQEMWCLGDLVGYGAEPDACVELARRYAAICLAGNHDLGVRGALPLEEFSRGAALAATLDPGRDHARDPRVPGQARAGQRSRSTVGLYHASPRDPVWEYVLSPLQAELCLDAQPHRVCLIGHSHVALSFSRVRRRIRPPARPGRPTRSSISSEGEWLINPGSVGQPRDGDPRAALARARPRRLGSAIYRRTEYDIAGAAAAIRAARLPDSLAERLAYGQ